MQPSLSEDESIDNLPDSLGCEICFLDLEALGIQAILVPRTWRGEIPKQVIHEMVYVKYVRDSFGAAPQQRLAAETSSGKIDAENLEGIITARASSGSIKILEARGGVKTLRTSSGEIWVELEEIYEGILEMSFQSTSGDINLSIPSDIGADIDIGTTSGRITTDFAVTASKEPWKEMSSEEPLEKGVSSSK